MKGLPCVQRRVVSSNYKHRGDCKTLHFTRTHSLELYLSFSISFSACPNRQLHYTPHLHPPVCVSKGDRQQEYHIHICAQAHISAFLLFFFMCTKCTHIFNSKYEACFTVLPSRNCCYA